MTDSNDVGAALEDAAKSAGFIDPTDIRMYLDPSDTALTSDGAPDAAMIAAAVTAVADQRPYLTNGGRPPRRGSAHQGAGRGSGAARSGLSVDSDAQLERLRTRDNTRSPSAPDSATTETAAGATGSRHLDRLRTRSPIHADHH